MSTRGSPKQSGARARGGSAGGTIRDPFADDRSRHDLYEWDRVSAQLARRLRGNTAWGALREHVLAPIEAAGARSHQHDHIAQIAARGKRDEAAAFLLLARYHTTFAHEYQPIHVAMQQAVKSEFGLRQAKSGVPAAAEARATAEYGVVQPGMRAFFRAMYDDTQRYLADHHISAVPVYRAVSLHDENLPYGLRFNTGAHDVTMTSKAITSYSTDARQAEGYTDGLRRSMVVGTILPASRILSLGYTGLGGLAYEREVVALGGRDHVRAIAKEFGADVPEVGRYSDAELASLTTQR